MSKKKSKAAKTVCPCGSGLSFDACCGRWLAGEPAPTPEVLMRSRYVAYVLENDQYVLETWATETRPEVLFEPGEVRPKWLSLTVLEAREAGDEGFVHFIARGRTSQGAFKLEEKSQFRREDGRWLYVKGHFE